MNNILALLAGILLFGGLLIIFYPQLRKRANPFNNGNSTILLSEVLEMDNDTERRIPISRLIPPSKDIECNDVNAIGNKLANPGLTISWRMFLNVPGGDRHWTTSYSRDKPILRIGSSPWITYNHKYNHLTVQLDYGKSSPFYSHRPSIVVPHVPLQTWNTWAVVIDGTEIKVYLNGVQVINKHLPLPPLLDTADIIIGQVNNNINGRLAKMQIHRTALTSAKLRGIA